MYSLVRVSAKTHFKETEAQIGEVSYAELPSENLGAKPEVSSGFSGFTVSAVLVQLPPPRGTCSRDLEGVDKEFQNSLWEGRHITENWLFANGNWISVNIILQIMRFGRTGGWVVCV